MKLTGNYREDRKTIAEFRKKQGHMTVHTYIRFFHGRSARGAK